MMTKRSVMVVDDDDDIRTTIEALLHQRGYPVLCAVEGAEALGLLRQNATRPGLILLDLMMPGMSGESFRAAQLRDPALADVPVVVLSGAGKLIEKAHLLGVEALQKPISLSDLLAIVSRFCDSPNSASGSVSRS
jgi:CheY-like chemotaxis protein